MAVQTEGKEKQTTAYQYLAVEKVATGRDKMIKSTQLPGVFFFSQSSFNSWWALCSYNFNSATDCRRKERYIIAGTVGLGNMVHFQIQNIHEIVNSQMFIFYYIFTVSSPSFFYSQPLGETSRHHISILRTNIRGRNLMNEASYQTVFV